MVLWEKFPLSLLMLWKDRTIREKDAQIERLNAALCKAGLKENLFKVGELLPKHPLEALILALYSIGKNFEEFPEEVLPEVRESLCRAVEISREENCLEGHEGPITAIEFMAGGKELISGCRDSNIRLWDERGEQLAEAIASDQQGIAAIAVSPSGRRAASGGEDGTIVLWEMEKRTSDARWQGHASRVGSLAFCRNGEVLASGGSDGTIRLWNCRGEPLSAPVASGQSDIAAIAVDSSGNCLASGSSDGTIALWTLQGDPVVPAWLAHCERISCLAFSPDGKFLLSGSWDGTALLWTTAGVPVGGNRPIHHDDYILSAAFSPDGRQIVTGSSDRSVALWDFCGNRLATCRGHRGAVRAVAFSPDGKRVASGSSDCSIRFWDVRECTLTYPLAEREGAIWAVAVSRDGQFLASGGVGGTLHLTSLRGEAIDKALQGHSGDISSVAIAPDGEWIASSGWDATLRLWTSQGKAIGELQGGDGEGAARGLAFSPDGSVLASGGDCGGIGLWTALGEMAGKLMGKNREAINCLAFSPDGSLLASGGEGGRICLWDWREGRITANWSASTEGINAIVFSPDGKAIASGTAGGTICLWTCQGQLNATLSPAHERYVSDLAFSLDGKLLVSCGGDRAIRLWSSNGKRLGDLWKEASTEITSLAWHPQEQAIFAGGLDGKLYRLPAGDERWYLAVARDRLQYHPIFRHPSTQVERQARQACQLYSQPEQAGKRGLTFPIQLVRRLSPFPFRSAPTGAFWQHGRRQQLAIAMAAICGLGSLAVGLHSFQSRRLCTPPHRCLSEEVTRQMYQQAIAEADSALIQLQSKDDPLALQSGRDRLSRALEQLHSISDRMPFARQSALHYEGERQRLEATLERARQSQQKFERVQAIIDRVRQQTAIAATQDGYRQALAGWQQLRQQLRGIERTAETEERLSAVLAETNANLEALEARLAPTPSPAAVLAPPATPPSPTATRRAVPAKSSLPPQKVGTPTRLATLTPKPPPAPKAKRPEIAALPPKPAAQTPKLPPAPKVTRTETAALPPKPAAQAPKPPMVPKARRPEIAAPGATPRPLALRLDPPELAAPPNAPPSSPASPSKPARSTVTDAATESRQSANQVARGLIGAIDNRQIRYGSRQYRQIQTAIALLRRGKSLESAARQAGVSLSLIQQLIGRGAQQPSLTLGSSVTQTARDRAIRSANDIAAGLLVAANKREIRHGSRRYLQVQTAIALLRRGKSLAEAARIARVSPTTLKQLIDWGQARPQIPLHTADTELRSEK